MKFKDKIKRMIKKYYGKVIINVPNNNCQHELNYMGGDWVRTSVLQIISQEISEYQVEGEVAELGVYQGDFAKEINKLFPDKDLFLYDTFSGFDEQDIEVEKKSGFSSGEQDFSDTSIELVKDKMSYLERVHFIKGYFPESTIGFENRKYAFVSIDVDLYEPIKAGLDYFYPRLSRGGYILIHDFDNKGYLGVRRAVVEFCKKSGIGYVRIPDTWGSVVISK